MRRTFGFLAAVVLGGSVFAAYAQQPDDDHTLNFTATVHASNPLKNWRGEWWLFFHQANPIRASITVVQNGTRPGAGNVVIGSETATLDFGEGDTFQLATSYIASGAKSKTGVYRMFQTGRIFNGTGIFKDASGTFSHKGFFGPGLRCETATSDWSGQYKGTLVGVTFEALQAKAINQIALSPAPVGSVDRQ